MDTCSLSADSKPAPLPVKILLYTLGVSTHVKPTLCYVFPPEQENKFKFYNDRLLAGITKKDRLQIAETKKKNSTNSISKFYDDQKSYKGLLHFKKAFDLVLWHIKRIY